MANLGKTSNRNSNGGPAGGLGSKNVKSVPIQKGGRREGVNPHFPNQLGSSIDPRAAEMMPAKAYNSGVPLGNAKALEAKAIGQGRTNHGPSGMQGTHGPVNSGNPVSVPRSGDVMSRKG